MKFWQALEAMERGEPVERDWSGRNSWRAARIYNGHVQVREGSEWENADFAVCLQSNWRTLSPAPSKSDALAGAINHVDERLSAVEADLADLRASLSACSRVSKP